MWFVRQGLLLSSFLLYTEAVSLPRTPETVTVRSNLDPLVSLSYKEVGRHHHHRVSDLDIC